MERLQFDNLSKMLVDLQSKLTGIAKEKGFDDGHVKADAIGKDELEKAKTDILDTIKKSQPVTRKFVFGGKDELKENEQRLSFGQYLLMVKAKHPAISESYMKTVMSEGSTYQGQYTIPYGYESMILGELNNASTIIPKCTRYPQSEMTVYIPRWLTDLSVAWIAEITEKSTTKPTITRVSSVLKKMYAIITFSDEYLADDISDITSNVAKLVAENMAVELERVALVGDVTGAGDAFNGIYYTTGVNTVPQAGANLSYSDMVDIWNNSSVLEKYRGKPEWYMNRSVFGLVLKLVDNNGRPIVNLINGLDKPQFLCFGDTVNISSQIPNTLGVASNHSAIIYGDYKYILLGEKKGKGNVEVDVSNSAIISTSTSVTENLWTLDETGYRFVMRRGVLVAVPAAYSVGTEIR